MNIHQQICCRHLPGACGRKRDAQDAQAGRLASL